MRFDSGRFGLYSRQGGHFVLDDDWHRYTDPDTRDTLVWSGRWHCHIDPAEGKLEFQDDAPGQQSVQLRKGYELRWGKRLRMGEAIEHKVMFEGADAPFNFHRLTLAGHYPSYLIRGVPHADVIRLDDSGRVQGLEGQDGQPGQANPAGLPKHLAQLLHAVPDARQVHRAHPGCRAQRRAQLRGGGFGRALLPRAGGAGACVLPVTPRAQPRQGPVPRRMVAVSGSRAQIAS